MNKYAFEHDDQTYLVEADSEEQAIEIFAKKAVHLKIDGKRVFFEEATLEDIKEDIEQGNIGVSTLIVL